MSELLQDIDERARVAFLEFDRASGMSKKCPETIEIIQTAFIGGFKTAMYEAIRLRLGLAKTNLSEYRDE